MEFSFKKRYQDREDLDTEPRPFWYLYVDGLLKREFYVVQYRVEGESFFIYPLSSYQSRENFKFENPEHAKRRLVEYYTELYNDDRID